MHSDSTSPTRPPWVLLGFLILIGITTLAVCTRHNSFPYTYHPDEDTKVRQIVSGKRNFFHPLLLLTTTSTIYHSGLVVKNPMNAAVAGRWVSAFFTALTVVALTLLAWRWGGWFSAIGTAALLLVNPLGFELAHYIKEDPALLFGLALTFLAMDFFWKKPVAGTAVFLGIATALAISGKYLGAVILVFALPLLIIRVRQNNVRLALWFVLGFVLTIVVANFPLLRHLTDFSHGLGREMAGATGGHRGLEREIPHAYYLEKMLEITPLAVWLGVGLTLVAVAWRWRQFSAVQILTLLFPFVFLGMLSFSPKTATRYVLPATMLISFLAGVAPGLLLRANLPKIPTLFLLVTSSLTIGAGVLTNWPLYQNLRADFSTDARDGLRKWIAENTNTSAVIAQDERVDLLANPAWKSREVITAEFAADLGSLEDLRSRKIDYVAVTRQSYNRFLKGTYKPKAKEKADFNRRAEFYRELFATGKPVWESTVGQIIYLHPGIRLYHIVPNP